MEAEIKLVSAKYDAAGQDGELQLLSQPAARWCEVLLEGASISADRIKQIIPIFEEGSVDEDLLNEGNRRLRDYYQQLGYFDVKVITSTKRSASDKEVVIVFDVRSGPAPPCE